MTLAYPTDQVRVLRVLSTNGGDLRQGSLWQRGQVLFKARHRGRELPPETSPLALALDDHGRHYFIWLARHPRANCLVIQPWDSQYCYSVCLRQAASRE